MSHLQRAIEKPGRRAAKALFELAGAEDHAAWISDFKDAVFHITGFQDINERNFKDTLDAAFFKTHKDFKTAYAAAAKDDENKTCDPFDDPDFARKCFDHTMDGAGLGMQDWVRSAYHLARDGLSRELKNQTGVVRRGDIFGLLRAIQLAVNQLEVTCSTRSTSKSPTPSVQWTARATTI